jgi:hypothetical protein
LPDGHLGTSVQILALNYGVINAMLSILKIAITVGLAATVLAGGGTRVAALLPETASEDHDQKRCVDAQPSPPGKETERPKDHEPKTDKDPADGKKPEDLSAYMKKLGRMPAELTKAKKSDAEIVDALYRASLKRAPDEAERAAATKLLDGAKDRTQKSRDILWAMVNSHEFLKLHKLDGKVAESLRLLNELSADWDKNTDAKK